MAPDGTLRELEVSHKPNVRTAPDPNLFWTPAPVLADGRKTELMDSGNADSAGTGRTSTSSPSLRPRRSASGTMAFYGGGCGWTCLRCQVDASWVSEPPNFAVMISVMFLVYELLSQYVFFGKVTLWVDEIIHLW